MNIIFLDYDGVVNTLIFNETDNYAEPNFNYPSMEKVNNHQAVCWLNKLCRETNAKIVVTSTWRLHDNYKECLYNGGLQESIEILGRTPYLLSKGKKRGDEIQAWIDKHSEDIEIDKFVILDDDTDMKHLKKYLVKCDAINRIHILRI